jgi:hypothetical protein
MSIENQNPKQNKKVTNLFMYFVYVRKKFETKLQLNKSCLEFTRILQKFVDLAQRNATTHLTATNNYVALHVPT